MSNMLKQVVLMSIAALALHCNSNVYAQNNEASVEIEEIVVTAARREQSLQEVSLSVSALSGDFLSNVGAEVLEDYYGFVPSVNAAHATVGERAGQNIIIRGISNTRVAGGDAGLLASTTGFYLDDVPITAVDTQLFDIDRVEVLRGPQGTLYGAASMGGAIKVYSKRANTTEFSGAIEGTGEVLVTGGGGGSLKGMVNVPIFDEVLGVRVVGTYRTMDGYLDACVVALSSTDPNSCFLVNSGLGITEIGTSDTFASQTNSLTSKSLRGSVLYTPNDRLTINAALLWQNTETDDQSQINSSFSQDRMRAVYMLEPIESEITLSTLNISYEFDAVTLFSDTGYYTREYAATVDFTPIMFQSFGAGLTEIPALGPLEDKFDINTLTWEVRLQSNHNDSSNAFLNRLDWVVGAYVMDESRYFTQLLHAPGWTAAAPGNPLPVEGDIFFTGSNSPEEDNKAVFADVSFNITDNLVAAVGIRFFDQSSSRTGVVIQPGTPDPANPGTSSFSQEEDGDTARLNVAYNMSDDLMFYGSYSEGFRLGGFQSPIDPVVTPECVPVIEDQNLQAFAQGQFQSDAVETYEIGVKSAFGGGRAVINASAYHTDWTDLQQQIQLGQFPPGDCTRTLTANVGSAEVDGFELELFALPTERIRLNAAVSYTDAAIKDPGLGITVVESGYRLINTPEWSGSLVADYTVPINLSARSEFFVRADARYMGERTSVTGPTTVPERVLDAYTLVGFRTGVVYGEEKPVTVTLFVNNILDEVVELNASGRFGVSSDIMVATGLPRTIGITVRKDF